MSVRDYYYAHFTELTPEKQFHFATRMKNYFKIHDFDDFLKNNQLSTNILELLSDEDYTKVSYLELRKPFFEKYKGLFGIEKALFRVHHLLIEYNLDIREDFLRSCPLDILYELSDNLLEDKEAFKTLSTWTVNTVYLTEELFPRGMDVISRLSETALDLDPNDVDATLLSYLYTHIILCKSGYYTKDVKTTDNSLMKQLLDRCCEVINNNINTVSLDACVEFLVCCSLIGVEYPSLRNKIVSICDGYKKGSPYLINYRHDKSSDNYYHTLDGAEHINVLYIMSGLDS